VGTLYVEVKTVHPSMEDSDANWAKYLARRERHTPHTHYIVAKDALGAALYGDAFATRSKFMEYTLEFERRLVEARKRRQGESALVFCGTGVKWHRDALEDFADFYETGRHRADDAFGVMEAAWIADEGIELRRNIDRLGLFFRDMDHVTARVWSAAVRGPRFAGAFL